MTKQEQVLTYLEEAKAIRDKFNREGTILASEGKRLDTLLSKALRIARKWKSVNDTLPPAPKL